MAASALLLIFLIFLVVTVPWFTRRYEQNPVLKFFPAPLWCYFLPMFASALGVIPREHALYPWLSRHLLPACLILLLLGVRLDKVWRLGPTALFSMGVGTGAIILGGPFLLFLFKSWMPADAWLGLGPLSGSWTGGSANMIAVSQAIGTPESIFSVMVIVDSIVAYAWMGLLIAIAPLQHAFDRWNGVGGEWMKEAGSGSWDLGSSSKSNHVVLLAPRSQILVPVIIAFTLGELSILIGGASPVATVILATTLGLGLSMTRISRLEEMGASKVGYFLLFLLLTSIGARADLSGIVKTPVYLLFGAGWVIFSGMILFLAARLFRIPMFFLATASQANIGGPVSAPIVAAVYQPRLAFVGLLLAILGNVMGTYLGIGCSWVMKWVMR